MKRRGPGPTTLATFARVGVTRGTRVGRAGRYGACVDESSSRPHRMELPARSEERGFRKTLQSESAASRGRDLNGRQLVLARIEPASGARRGRVEFGASRGRAAPPTSHRLEVLPEHQQAHEERVDQVEGGGSSSRWTSGCCGWTSRGTTQFHAVGPRRAFVHACATSAHASHPCSARHTDPRERSQRRRSRPSAFHGGPSCPKAMAKWCL